MPKNINSAFRVQRVLARAAERPPVELVKDVWADVFHLGAARSGGRDLAVAHLLGLLQNEIDDARTRMRETTFSAELYADAFANAEAVTGVDTLSASWHEFRTHLTPETLRVLQFCSEVLPNEEDAIDADALDAVAAELQAFLDTLREGDLPADVQAFIKRQIQIVLDALRDYQIVGAKAFGDALVRASADAAMHPDAAHESVTTPQFQSLKRAWEFLKEADKGTEIFAKVLAGGTVVAKLLGTLAGTPRP